jgi:hypothetical protein
MRFVVLAVPAVLAVSPAACQGGDSAGEHGPTAGTASVGSTGSEGAQTQGEASADGSGSGPSESSGTATRGSDSTGGSIGDGTETAGSSDDGGTETAGSSDDGGTETGAAVHPLAGEWTGIYGSGILGLSFVVDDLGNVVDFTLTTNAGTCGSGDFEVEEPGPIAIAPDGSIELLDVMGCGDGCATIDLTGTLEEAGGSGTFEESYFNGLCFGGSVNPISWEAARDCSLVPEQGVSATRFCRGGGGAGGPVSQDCYDCGAADCAVEADACASDPVCVDCVLVDYADPSCGANAAWQDLATCSCMACAAECAAECG